MTLYKQPEGKILCDYCNFIFYFDRLVWVNSVLGGNSGFVCPMCNKVSKEICENPYY